MLFRLLQENQIWVTFWAKKSDLGHFSLQCELSLRYNPNQTPEAANQAPQDCLKIAGRCAEAGWKMNFPGEWVPRSRVEDLCLKETVHPKTKILSSFTHPQVDPNLYECVCSEHKGRYSEESL